MDIGNARYQFGGVGSARAEALGQPGQRRFRLLLQAGAAAATLWLEKEQLRQLALLVEELLESTSAPAASSAPLPAPALPPGAGAVEFSVGRMALGHDPSRDAILILVHDVSEEREDAPPTLSFWLARRQAQELAREALAACAAGRPRCALCGGPVDPTGHPCPRSNGHGTPEGLP